MKALTEPFNLALLGIFAICAILAGCSMADVHRGMEIGANVLTSVAPLLPPDAMSAIQQRVAEGAPAVGEAFGAVANALRVFEANTAAQIAEQGQLIAQQAEALASRPTMTDTALVGVGAGSGGTVASRVLSHYKRKKTTAAGSAA